jgi:nitrogen fixation-related uncharacterized protein
MSYYAMFILYIVVGFGITAGLFFWAVKKGQFKQQSRARYLVLDGITPLAKENVAKKKWPMEIVITVIVASAGLALLLAFALVIAAG